MGLTFDFFNTIIEPKDKYVMKRAYKAIYDVGVEHGLVIDFSFFIKKAQTNWEKVLRRRMDEGRETLYNNLLLRLLKDAGMPLSEASAVIDESTSIYFEILESGVQLVEGAYEVLEVLSKKYSIGLITNFTYPPFVREQLNQHNISDFFEVVTISGEHGISKPFPKIFQHTLRCMNLKPHNVVHIGDSLECDVIGAKKAGLKAIWIKRFNEQKTKDRSEKIDCKHRSDLTIRTLSELLEVNLDTLVFAQ